MRAASADSGGSATARSASSSTSTPPAATTTIGPSRGSRTRPTETSTPAGTSRCTVTAGPRRAARSSYAAATATSSARPSSHAAHVRAVPETRGGGLQHDRPADLASGGAGLLGRRLPCGRRASARRSRPAAPRPRRPRAGHRRAAAAHQRARRASSTTVSSGGQVPVRGRAGCAPPAGRCGSPRGPVRPRRGAGRRPRRRAAAGRPASTTSGRSVAAATSSTASTYDVSPSYSGTRSTASAVTPIPGSAATAARQSAKSPRVSAPPPHTSSGFAGSSPSSSRAASRSRVASVSGGSGTAERVGEVGHQAPLGAGVVHGRQAATRTGAARRGQHGERVGELGEVADQVPGDVLGQRLPGGRVAGDRPRVGGDQGGPERGAAHRQQHDLDPGARARGAASAAAGRRPAPSRAPARGPGSRCGRRRGRRSRRWWSRAPAPTTPRGRSRGAAGCAAASRTPSPEWVTSETGPTGSASRSTYPSARSPPRTFQNPMQPAPQRAIPASRATRRSASRTPGPCALPKTTAPRAPASAARLELRRPPGRHPRRAGPGRATRPAPPGRAGTVARRPRGTPGLTSQTFRKPGERSTSPTIRSPEAAGSGAGPDDGHGLRLEHRPDGIAQDAGLVPTRVASGEWVIASLSVDRVEFD